MLCPEAGGDDMRRREFITLLAAGGDWPRAAHAQQPTMPVIGFLDPRSHHTLADQLRAFRQGLKDAGYVEGENVAIEYRWAEDQYDRLPALAAELVRRRVAVIITNGGPPAAVAALSRRRGDRIEALGIMQGRQARCANFQDAGSALPGERRHRSWSTAAPQQDGKLTALSAAQVVNEARASLENIRKRANWR